MKFRNLSVVAITALTLAAPSARAWDLSAVGALNLEVGNLGLNPAATLDSQTTAAGFGGGLLLNERFIPTFEVEVGLLALTRNFNFTFTQAPLPQAQDNAVSYFLYFPVTVRYVITPWLAAGLGGYVANGFGNITDNITIGGTTTPNPNSWEQDQIRRFDYGLLASAQATVPIAENLGVVGDVRFNWSLQNAALQGPTALIQTANFRFLDILLGLKYAL